MNSTAVICYHKPAEKKQVDRPATRLARFGWQAASREFIRGSRQLAIDI